MDANQHLKRPIFCGGCGWAGLSGDLIAKQKLVCPKCSSDEIKYFVADAPEQMQ